MRDTSSRGLARLLAILVALVALVALLPDSARAATSWAPVGPNDVGMILAIAGGRSAVYAATCNGVYRSDDGAASWHESGLQQKCVIRLAVDPRGDADTLYAIVDNLNFVSAYPEPSSLAHIGVTLILGSTLWVSRDGGGTWSNRELASGNALAIDPTQPGTAYVANFDPIYGTLAVTHDFGTTWRQVADAPDALFLQLAVDPRDGVLYCASGFLSTLSAGSWSSLAIAVTTVAAGSGSDGAVYAAGPNTFCRKTNAASWTCVALPGETPLDILEIPAQPRGPGQRVLLLTFHGILSSDDGGASFSPVSSSPPGFTPVAALDPSGAAVYAGNDLGVYRSPDRGATWTKSSAGLRSTWVRALAVDPEHPSTVWAGAEGRISDIYQVGPGLFRSTNGGESWASASVAGEPGYVFSLGIDPSNPRNLFTASRGKADRSADGGASWSETGTGTLWNFIHALTVDPASSSKVWAASDGGLQASDDGGGTWSPALSASVYSLLFDSRHPGTIYAGEADQGSYYPYGTGFAVQTSRDNGATWRRTGSELEGAVTAFATDPFTDGVVYAATYAGTILRSTDSGATWTHWNTTDLGFSIFTLVADPVRSGSLYLGGWVGAYRSLDGGKSWDPFVEGLEPYGVFGLAITPDGEWLYAGTTGGGVFRQNLFVAEREPVSTVSRPREPRTVPRR